MNKRIVNEQVAIIHSGNYGSGWYTWNGIPQALYDSHIVDAILKRNYCKENSEEIKQINTEIQEYYKLAYGDEMHCRVEDLRVAWIPQGSRFYLHEYDGLETVIMERDHRWLIAQCT